MNNGALPSCPTIGVLAGWPFYDAFTYNFLESNFLDSVLRGIRAAAHQYQCHLLIACGIGSARDDDQVRPAWPVPDNENTFIPVSAWNTDGLIVFNPLLSTARSEYIQNLRRQGHPIVFFGTAEEGSAVALDNEGGIRQALHHLMEHGHQSVAFIAGHQTDITGDGGERLRAFLRFAREFDLRLDDRLVAYGNHSIRGGQAAMRQILASGVGCTAVLASNDESAIGAMRVLREKGYQIPRDMAVIGFDNRPAALAQNPPLTTINIPTFERGYRALELLIGMIHEERSSVESIIINSSSHLVIRQSCGCQPDELFEYKLQSTAHLPANAEHATVLNMIARPILSEARRLSSATLFGMCRRLFDAFATSLQSGDTGPFRHALTAILDEIVQAGENAYVWQMAMTNLVEYFAAQDTNGE